MKVAVVPEMVPVPKMVEPSLNVTVPVAPLLTVAVKVTLSPNMVEVTELLSEVVDGVLNNPVASRPGDRIASMYLVVTILMMGVFETNGPIRLFKPDTTPLVLIKAFPRVTAPAFATVPFCH